MQKIRLKILGLFKSKKINIFLLFFLLAFSILVLTKLSKVYTATIAFNVNPKNINDTQVLVNTKNPELEITIETTGFNWLRYAMKRPKIDIDFIKDVTKKDSTFIWSVSKGFPNINKQFNKDQKVISINPDTLLFKFDVNAIKYVPIILNTNINYAQGYNTLDHIKSNPDSVKLIGPASVLKKINTIGTQKSEFNDLKSSINEVILLKLDSLNSEVKTDIKKVRLSVKVSKFSEGILNLPIEVINIPDGKTINYFPKEVSLSYTTSLENYNNITPKDFKVICDFKNATENYYLMPILIKQPKGVKNIRFLQQKIEYIISK